MHLIEPDDLHFCQLQLALDSESSFRAQVFYGTFLSLEVSGTERNRHCNYPALDQTQPKKSTGTSPPPLSWDYRGISATVELSSRTLAS